MLSKIVRVMFILLVLIVSLIGMALVIGENLQSPTIVTYEYQPQISEVFYLTDEQRNLDFTVMQHPCLTYLRDMYSVKHGWVIVSVWTANASYTADNRQILITDFSTGFSCGFGDEYSSP